MGTLADRWLKFHRQWLIDFKFPLLLVKYENMKSDLGTEILRILGFLDFTVTDAQLQCVLEEQEGQFHRVAKKDAYRFSTGIHSLIAAHIEQLAIDLSGTRYSSQMRYSVRD